LPLEDPKRKALYSNTNTFFELSENFWNVKDVVLRSHLIFSTVASEHDGWKEVSHTYWQQG